MVGGEAGLEHKHSGVEVKGRFGSHVGGPVDLVGALLAVADLVLRAVAPSLFAEAVHDCVEVGVWVVEEVVYVAKHLDVAVQVYHLAVLYELQHVPRNHVNINIFTQKKMLIPIYSSQLSVVT